MSDRDLLTSETEAELARLGGAELLVGLAPPPGTHEEGAERMVQLAREGLQSRFPESRTAVLVVRSDGEVPQSSASGDPVPVIHLGSRTSREAAAGVPAERWPGPAVRAVFLAAGRCHARAAALLDAEVLSATSDWVGRLLDPLVSRDFDLVAPWYLRHPYGGAVTSGIVYPLTRALFGRRLRFPLGSDFACSGRMMDQCLGRDIWQPRTGARGVELRLTTTAVEGGLRICQAMLGPRTVSPAEPPALSAILAEVLGLIFTEMERSTAVWQKVRGSVPVELLGPVPDHPLDPVAVELKRLLDPFRLAQQNLREVWGLVLPPSTLVELRRLAGAADPDFRIPDRLWARIVYDFSLAFRLRTMSRDHLMGALAPLYLGWFGSLVAEMDGAEPSRIEQRLEALCLHFEAEKPYLISRWRWPDRFNP